MSREILFATVIAAALSVGASAQSGYGAGEQKQPAKSAGKTQAVTVTGCLQSGDQSNQPGAPGTSAAGTSGTSASGSDTMGTAGSKSSASKSSSSSGSNYVLTNATGSSAAAGSDRVTISGSSKLLQKHVGHKVQVRGKEDPSGTLRASSVKMIASSCSGQ